jgi:VWFA-related protein
MRCPLPLALVLVLAAPPLVRPQTKEADSGAAASAVLDVVVKDKKGDPIPDLRPEEVELLENGSPRPIESGGSVRGAAARGGGGAPGPGNLVSFVFDGLDPNQQKLAQRAAEEFLAQPLPPNTFIAVFRIGLQLWTVQPFTSDLERVKEAVTQAASHLDTTLAEPDAEARRQVAEALASVTRGETTDPAAAARLEVLGRIIRQGDRLQRQRQYDSPIYLLMAIAKGQATAPGRKAVLYFSTGFEVPGLLDDVFKATMSEANRAHVSFYTLDVSGLGTYSQSQSARDAIEEVAATARAQAEQTHGAVTRSQATLGDRTEASTRTNVLQPLRDLAEATGGESTINTNDFKKAAERIAADLSGHYEIAYAPASTEWDGAFRRLEVKVSRKGARVADRNGYFATEPDNAGPILAYEQPLLEALKSPEPRHDFDLAAGAFHFNATDEGRDLMLVAEVPLSQLKFTIDEKEKLYKLHFALLAVVKDAEGKAVERVSQDYPFQGPLDKVPQLQQGNVVFKRHLVLAPGSYTLEIVAQDPDAGLTSVKRMPLEVPAAGEKLRLSSIAIIRRVEPAAAPEAGKDADPFQVETARIVPSLDDPISKALTPKISIYMIAYPQQGGSPPMMTVEFSESGHGEGRAQAPLPPPEKDGRIRYLGTFPIDRFAPGRHELKLSVRQGDARAEESVAFTLQP